MQDNSVISVSHFGNRKKPLTFAPDDESLKRLVAHRRVFFDAVYSRMRNGVQLSNRNPVFPQLPRLPFYTQSAISDLVNAKNGLTCCCDCYSFLRLSNESAGSSRMRTFSAQDSLVCDGRRPYINVHDCNDSST